MDCRSILSCFPTLFILMVAVYFRYNRVKQPVAVDTAFIYNSVSWHSEVTLSYVKLMQDLGARRIVVFDESLRTFADSKDYSSSTFEACPTSGQFLDSLETICSKNSSLHVKYLIFVTPEARNFMLDEVERALSEQCREVDILWTCHNVRPCRDSLGVRKSTRKVTIVVPTNEMRRYFESEYPDVLFFMPLFSFREDKIPSFSIQSYPSQNQEVLVPGSVNFSKRNYNSLLAIGVQPRVTRVNVFGKCLGVLSCRYLELIAARVKRNNIIVEHSGHFLRNEVASMTVLRTMLGRSRYIFPAINFDVPLAENYVQGGKLSSSISLAVSTAKPLILWCKLRDVYGFERQLCYSTEEEISSIVKHSFQILEEEYISMRVEMATYKRTMTSSFMNSLGKVAKHSEKYDLFTVSKEEKYNLIA